MLCGSLDGKGVGGEWIHVYAWLSCFAMHLKLSHIVNRLYSNIKLKVKKKSYCKKKERKKENSGGMDPKDYKACGDGRLSGKRP